MMEIVKNVTDSVASLIDSDENDINLYATPYTEDVNCYWSIEKISKNDLFLCSPSAFWQNIGIDGLANDLELTVKVTFTVNTGKVSLVSVEPTV